MKATGEDPIRWLEERMAAPQRRGTDAPGESEILSSLRRFLERTGKGKRRKQRVGAKK
jgi:hypothetical protein